MSTQIKCPRCGGSGRTQLDGILAATLAEVKKHRNGVTAAELRNGHDDISPATFHARLEKLRFLGLVGRVRIGTAWSYSAL